MASGIRVLHVDDDTPFRELTQRYLEREGLDVVSADGATTALETLDESIDCIVSDFDMPGCDGLGLLETVRERDPDVPFILFTAKGSEEIASEAISAGVTDYLQKETSADQFAVLANRIERAVAERRTETALVESERMLSTLISNLPGVVYRCRNEPDWPMEYIGGNVAELTGYEPRAFLGGRRSWRALIHEEDREKLWNTIQQAIGSKEPFEVTYRITDDDGETRWLRERGRGVFEDGDEPVALEGFITDVTRQKRDERDLYRYDRLLEAIGDPVYTTDPDGHVRRFNDRAAELTGYDKETVIGEHVSMLLDDEELDRGQSVVRSLLEEGGNGTATYEMTIQTADGGTRSVENHAALLIDDGEFHGTIGVLRSVDDRTTTRLRRLHEATRQLMAATDIEGVAERTTHAAAEVLGQPIASVCLADDDELVLTAATDAAAELLGEQRRYLASETPAGRAFMADEIRVENEFDESKGEAAGVRSAAYFPLGDHGVFVIASSTPDGFEEREIQLATVLAANAEAALDRAIKETELRNERDDFAALFENIPDPTVEVTMVGAVPIVENVNAAFEAVFGHTAEEIVGESLDDYIVPPDDEGVANRYNTEIQSGKSFHGEVRRLAADGPRDFILHVAPHRVGAETTKGYAIYTDITDRKERERELARRNERLDEFASVVSHDLRNPLSVAHGRLELARETGEKEHFDAIEDAHNRMTELINGLLTLAKQGELVGERRPVNLSTVAAAAWETVSTEPARLRVDDDVIVEADSAALRRLLENLFRNAVEHGTTQDGRDGAEPLSVSVGALDGGFYVEDDGVGVPEDERETVFQSGVSSAGGTGFGLTIVEEIAAAHDWRVTLTESDAGGARFEFRHLRAVDG